ncbi:unnamed protein product [Adineta steineri]|uniref:TIR domain-containing protein n=1 Tax=Adineta steineri TaxID=433720 RepID=A0A815RYY8_9BILA|nr:unnamed protein product [Adineta steineri]CAF1639603.1 unnamed protein product [Adineta steineri]
MDTSISLTDNSIITNHNQQKRHIMISYDRSSIRTCRKIYNRLIERNYKVWMDLEHMFDEILVAMAQVIKNSYIILLCISQQYYESDSCRLEKFQPKSWLGIIKGSNVHIDFSSQDDFDESFEQLIRQITFIEK